MRWETEELFERHYFSSNDPKKQIEDLADWRRQQLSIVGKLKDIIRLVANEQYSELDHFVLELLQNADDNEYDSDSSPSVRMELFEDRLELANNESGFTADDVYSITYAAASTKRRKATAATYIGEKGIGFKSVFAVAKYVDVHSNGYHFRLKNDEFIVPHLLKPTQLNETNIVLSFRDDRKGIANTLSKRLQQIGEDSQQFLLFLQKLKHLEIVDHLANKTTTIRALKDANSQDVTIRHGNTEQTYLRIPFEKTLPREVVLTRFKDLAEPLPRETVIAVPVPKEGAPLPESGNLFCFLPTRVSTGVPLHIQVDGKTTTNRENVQEFGDSAWNEAVFTDLSECLVATYKRMTEDKRFHARLPEYWPSNDEGFDTNNDDLDAILIETAELLLEEPIVMDRHGVFKRTEDVVMVPEGWEKWLYEDKYENELNGHTFVDVKWSQFYREKLADIGVAKIGGFQFVAMLKAGVPDAVASGSEVSQRDFLNHLIDESKNSFFLRHGMKKCPVFPLVRDGNVEWGNLVEDVLWVKTETTEVPDTIGVAIVNPSFTFAPGGSAKKQDSGLQLAEFNKRFRRFLQDDLDIQPFSEAELLKRTVIERLQNLGEANLKKPDVRREIGGLWKRLYTRVWRRRRTLQKEIGEESLQGLFEEIGKCYITVRRGGKGAWDVTKAGVALLNKPFIKDAQFEKIYGGTNAPLVKLELEKRPVKKTRSKKKGGKKKTDEWKSWREFLTRIGSKRAPYICNRNPDDFLPGAWSEWIGSSSKHYPRLKNAVDTAVKSHWEFHGSNYRLSSRSLTKSLDEWTLAALQNELAHEYIVGKMAGIHLLLADSETDIEFIWGNMRKNRYAETDVVAVHDQLGENLLLPTTQGLKKASTCFSPAPINKKVLTKIAPVISSNGAGYDEESLAFIGVKGEVTVSDLLNLIRQAAAKAKKEESEFDFTPFGEGIAEFLEWRPEQTEEVLRVLKVWDEATRELIPLRQWSVNADPSENSTVARLLSIIDAGSLQSPKAAIEAIFDIQDQGMQSDTLAFRLSGLGKRASIDSEFGNEIRTIFDEKLANQGLKIFGNKVNKRTQLPFIWTGHSPVGKIPNSIVAISGRIRQNADLSYGLKILDWPCLTNEDVGVAVSSVASPIDDRTSGRIVGSVSVLTQKISVDHPDVAEKLSRVGYFASRLDAVTNIKQAKSLKVSIKWGRRKAELGMSFWVDEDKLYLHAGKVIAHSLAAFIDEETKSTIAWIFDSIWNSYEVDNFVDSGLDSPEAPMRAPVHPDQRDYLSENGDIGSVSDADDIFGEDDQDQDEENGSAETTSGGEGPRRRLRSMVMSRGSSGREGGAEGGQESSADNKVEKRGCELFRTALENIGAVVVSREKENIGYDFDVGIGDLTLNIELKSSKDKWVGWEHALSRNEFLSALKLGDSYYFCAIDQVFGDNPQIYFIKNPANNVDDYLFDHPWKSRALGLKALEAQLKAKAGYIDV